MRRRSQRLRNRNEFTERAKRISPSGEVRTKQTTIKKKRLTRKTLQKIRLPEERSTFQIPNEIVLHAFTYLVGDQDFVENAPCVCREWYNYVDQKSLWIGALNRRGLSLSILDKKNDENRIEDSTDMKPLFFHNLKNLGLKNKGTEGKCFQVYERSSGRIFAMKRARVYPDGEGVPYYMLRELAFLSSASHNHICNLQRVHLHDSSLHVFFEYVHTTLHDLINPTKLLHAGKALPRKQVKVFMWQLLSAVAYCHSRGVLHRNLKPKHILVKDVKNSSVGKKLLITDFALVRLTSVPLKTFTAEVVTLWYRAPEVLMGGEYVVFTLKSLK